MATFCSAVPLVCCHFSEIRIASAPRRASVSALWVPPPGRSQRLTCALYDYPPAVHWQDHRFENASITRHDTYSDGEQELIFADRHHQHLYATVMRQLQHSSAGEDRAIGR